MASTSADKAGVAEKALIDIDAEELKALSIKHNLERKELEYEIQEMKKKISKTAKTKATELKEQIKELEADMKKRHAEEIADLQERHKFRKNQSGAPEQEDNEKQLAHNSSMASDQTMHKTNLSARFTHSRLRADYLAGDLFSPQATEARALEAKLKNRRLIQYNIPVNGDCLYNAICHQLTQARLGTHNVGELRAETANYIHSHKAKLMDCMANPKTGSPLDDTEFANYCDAIRKSTALGGQVELKALSTVLRVPIEVLQGEGPTLDYGSDEFEGPCLVITYHAFLYSSGEHYNSTMPLIE